MENVSNAVTLLCFTLLMSGCASTRLASFDLAQGKAALEDDESRLWIRSDEEQEKLESGGNVYQDKALEEYVNAVLLKITPDKVKNCGLQIKAKVIKDPRLNAFCFPDGTMYLHTGILARMDNEAQLAALLGHEINHAIYRHSVKFFRDLKNKTAFYNTFSVLASAVGGTYGQAASTLGYFGTLAAIYGYSKDNEREADKRGFLMVLDAGYDIKEAPVLFKHLQENFDKEKKNEPFVFGTHPRLQERVDSYNDLIKEVLSEGGYVDKDRLTGKEKFIEMTHGLVLDNASFDISMGRFETAKAGIKKYLEQDPNSAKGHYYLAEVYMHQYEQPRNKRLKDTETKEEKKLRAIQYYGKAIELDPNFPLSYKALGVLCFKEDKKEEAKRNLAKYLELSPDAEDAPYVKNYLKGLEYAKN